MPKFKHWPHVNKGWKEVKREMIADPAGGPGLERIWRQRTFGQIKYAQAFFEELGRLQKEAAKYMRMGKRIKKKIQIPVKSTSPSVKKFLKERGGIEATKKSVDVPTKPVRGALARVLRTVRKGGATGKAVAQSVDAPSPKALAAAAPVFPTLGNTAGTATLALLHSPAIIKRRKQYLAAAARKGK